MCNESNLPNPQNVEEVLKTIRSVMLIILDKYEKGEVLEEEVVKPIIDLIRVHRSVMNIGKSDETHKHTLINE